MVIRTLQLRKPEPYSKVVGRSGGEVERRKRSGKFEPGLASRGVVLVVCRRFAQVSFSPVIDGTEPYGGFDPSLGAFASYSASPTHSTRVGTIVATLRGGIDCGSANSNPGGAEAIGG